MVRIIPWNLPPVNGGSIGGYTPKVEPTPEPTPIPYNYPYILDDIQIVNPTIVTNLGNWRQNGTAKVGTITYYHWYRTVGNSISVGLSGVEIVDTQNVSSVIANLKVSGTMVVTYYDLESGFIQTKTKTSSDLNVDVQIDITSVMTSIGGSRSTVANIGGTVETYVGRNKSSANHDSLTDLPPGPVTITTSPTITLESIMVYNSNGVVLQEWTPPEEEEE